MSLNARTIRSLVKAERPGMWAARNGLNLVISASGSPCWSIRYTNSAGKRRLMKLADYEPVDEAILAGLEAEAATHRKAVLKGSDPLAAREAAMRVAMVEAANPAGDTFKQAALTYIGENKACWKGDRHRTQWENSLITYVYPIVGDKLVHEVTMDDVKRILQQPYERAGIKSTLWAGARETATRIRSRIDIVVSAAKAKAIADNSNAARQALWRNHHNPAELASLRYAGLTGKQTKSNFKAMDWQAVPAFMKDLITKPDISAKALALTILCATRSNETFNATWSEIDLDNATWTIPAARMKAGKEHRVPLSSAAITLLKNMPTLQGNHYAFPGAKRERPLSDMAMLEMLRGIRKNEGLTVHGFRSAFRDWITETTLHPDAIAEQALAHAVGNNVERAYRRGDAFERRKDLMQQWCDYLLLDRDAYAQRWSKLLA